MENNVSFDDAKRIGEPPESKPQRAPLGEIFTRDFLMLSTINLAMFFGFQMLNIGLPVYMAQLGAAGQVIGLATTLMTVMATIMRVFAGALLDRFGRWGMLIGGAIIMVCAITSFAIFPIVGVILGLRLLHGVGWGMGSTASSTIAADIIPKRRFAEGMGYFAMTTAISSAIAPAASVALLQGTGAESMIYVAAGVTALSLVLSVIEALLARRAKTGSTPSDTTPTESERHENAGSKPAEADRIASAETPIENNRAENAVSKPAENAAPKGEPVQPQPHYTGIEALFERRAVVPGVLMFLVNVGFGCITTFIALHDGEQGGNGVSAYFLVYALVTLVSRPYIGKLIDRYGYRVPAILSTLCTAGTLALIGISTNTPMFACAGMLAGLGIGTAMGTFQSMAVASVEPWRRGVATSTYMTAFDLGIAVGSLVGGIIADAAGYTIMYFTVALFPIAASIISAVIIKRNSTNQKENQS